MGPGGTIREGPSRPVDQFLGLREGSWLGDYNNRNTDEFLKLLSSHMPQGADLQYAPEGTRELVMMMQRGELPGRQFALETLKQRQNLRSGKARAFTGPDGNIQYMEQGGQGWDQPLPDGLQRITGDGPYNPGVEAFRKRPAGLNSGRTWRSDMASMNPGGGIAALFRR